jgi:hypothetical protein
VNPWRVLFLSLLAPERWSHKEVEQGKIIYDLLHFLSPLFLISADFILLFFPFFSIKKHNKNNFFHISHSYFPSRLTFTIFISIFLSSLLFCFELLSRPKKEGNRGIICLFAFSRQVEVAEIFISR